MIIKFKRMKKIIGFILVICIVLSNASLLHADTVTEIQQAKNQANSQKQEAQQQLDNIKDSIDNISDDKASAEEQLEELDNLLVDLLLEVGLLEADIADKKVEIAQAEEWRELTVARVEAQQQAMNLRIKYMYEKGNESYIEILLESKSMADAVNRVAYTEKLYAYDRMMLEAYMLAKKDVAEIQEQLATDLSELEEMEEDLKVQEEELNTLIAEKQEEVEDFSNQLDNAKSKASQYQSVIKQQSDALKQLNKKEQEAIAEEARRKAEEEAKRKAEEAARKKAEEDAARNSAQSASNDNSEESTEASSEETSSDGAATENTTESSESSQASSTASSSTTTTTASASGSGKGAEIANFALQFVGNPYVSGGTSLTNGADCSGFTQSVFSNFGISIPRSSYAQSAAGTEVPLSEMSAGDIIYYGGHVGIYIGNNQIVHASTPATGIKVSSASYRSIITVRRYY